LDFNETFAPTLKFTTLRVIFSLVVHLRLHCEQTDVDCAFSTLTWTKKFTWISQRGFVSVVRTVHHLSAS
jgi:hypothetical protein